MIPDDRKSWLPYQVIVMSIDPSGRGKDETGYSIVGYLHGMLFLLDAGGFIGGYDDSVLLKLASLGKQWNINVCNIESTWGDGMFAKLFAPVLHKYHPCAIEEVKSYVQKEARIIDTVEPVMNQHRLVVNSTLIHKDVGDDQEDLNDKYYQLFYQMTRLTRDKGSLAHDDRIDALEMSVAYFQALMDRDVAKTSTDAKKAQFEKELASWTQDMYGFGGDANQPTVF
jgi:hypothetical protein